MVETMEAEPDRISYAKKNAAWAGCIFAITFVIAFLFARYTMNSHFEGGDDEGYLLISLKHYLGGERLYSQVFTQYGPFYYLLEGSLFRVFHLPVTHDSGRMLTLMFWLLSSAASTYFVYRISKSATLAATAGLVATGLERVLGNNPNHPQQVVLPMLVLACCAALTPSPAAMAILGAIGAALFLTKLNVGIFYLAALFGALACGLPKGTVRKTAITLYGIYVLFFPLFVMHHDLGTWAKKFCFVAVMYGVSTLMAGETASPEMEQPWSACLYSAAGAMFVAIATAVATIAQGVSASTLFRGVVLDPLRRNGFFEIGYGATRRDTFAAILITAAVAAVYSLRRRRPQTYQIALKGFRIVAGACGVVALLLNQDQIFNVLHPRVMAALPIALLPPAVGRWQPKEYFPRLFVTLLTATQFIQAYPVEGSQCFIAAAPLLLWSFVCVYDGLEDGEVANLVTGRIKILRGRLTVLSLFGGTAFVLLGTTMLRGGVWRGRFPDPASRLQGSQSMHLPKRQEDVYLSLANEIKANCDVLFSMPGSSSFNFWSGVPSPNGFNHDAWVTHLTPEEKQPIFAILQANPRSCVLYNEQKLRDWQATPADVEASALARYIAHDMPTVYAKGNYEIRVSPRRQSGWIETDPSSSSQQ